MLDCAETFGVKIALEILEIAEQNFVNFYYNSALLCEFNRIRDEVHEHLLQTLLISEDIRILLDFFADLEMNLNVVAFLPKKHFREFLHFSQNFH